MAKLTRAARNEIVDLISPFIETSEERQALLKDALIDTSALGNIDYSGPIREFAIHLISELASYGTVEQDKYALWALLETVRGRVGGDKQARIDALRDIVNAEIEVEPDARPEAPTSSPAWFNSFVLLMRVVVGVIALVMLVASGAWLFVDPGFEPLLGVLGGVIGLLAAFEALAETLVKRLPINLMVIAFIVVVALVMLGGSSAIVTQQNALATATQVIQSAQATADVAQEQARRNLLSSLALRASLPVNVDDLANVPSALAIAPGGDAPAVWGYGEANGALFAIDTTTGAPLPVWEGGYIFPLRPELSESFRPSALHFDGEWLWIGDSTGQQVVALDPATLAEQVRWSPGGVPVAITSADGALWVALGDLDKLVAVTFDRDTGEPSPHCPRERLTIGEAPSTLAAEGGVAVWVGYGRGEAGAVRRVSVQGCEAGEPVTLGARPAQLAASDDVLWAVVEGGALYRIDTATQEAVRVELPGLEVKAVLPAGDKLWVADAAGPSLVVLDLETGAARLTIPLNAPPLALARHGAQVWLSTGDDFVTQFIAPEYVHPGLVDVVGAEGALWLVDTGGNLSKLAEGTENCTLLDGLDGAPTALAASSDPDALWLATNAKTIWRVDLTGRSAEPTDYVLDAPALELVEETGAGRLWALNAETIPKMLAAFDLESGERLPVRDIAGRLPDHIAYDGATLWFAYSGASDQLAPVTYNPNGTLTPGPAIALDVPARDVLADEEYLYVASRGMVRVLSRDGEVVEVGLGQGVSVLVKDRMKVWGVETRSGLVYAVK